MSYKKIILMTGLCALFFGCSTARYGNMDMQGQANNETEIGMRYLLGRGVIQNNEKAFYYFSKAAHNDDPFAQNELAYLYAAGKGTPRNYEKAVYYYQKAAAHDLASAQFNLGLLYLYGMGTPRNPTVARELFLKASNHGFEPARRMIGSMNESRPPLA